MEFSKVEEQRAYFEAVQGCDSLDLPGLTQYLDDFFTTYKDRGAITRTGVSPSALASATAITCFKDHNLERISFTMFIKWINSSK
jgi:hypothetical protein